MNRARSHRRLLGLLCGAVLFSPLPGWALNTSLTEQYPQLGRSLRAQGMGNATLTMKGVHVTDMFYNPAALHDLDRRWEISTLQLNAAANIGILDTVKDLLDMSDEISANNATDSRIAAFEKFRDAHIGQLQTIDLTLPLISAGRRDIGVSLLLDSRTTIAVRDRFSNNFDLKTRNDGAMAIGGSYGFFFDDLVVGALVKGIYRIMFDQTITQRDIIRISGGSSLNELVGFSKWGKAFGIGGDLGVRYHLPNLADLNPTVAVTYQDIGTTRFFGSDTDDTPQSVNAAVGVHPQFGDFGVSVEFGASQLNQRRDFMTQLRTGAEVRFPRLGLVQVSARAGANQGYPTAGLSIDFKKASLDVAFFGEETGDRSRRGASYKLATGFGFYF